MIETNSYQCSVGMLCEHLGVTESEAADLMVSSVKIAQDARDEWWRENMQLHPGKSNMSCTCITEVSHTMYR